MTPREQFRAYREHVLAALRSEGWSEAAARAAQLAAKRLRVERQGRFAPNGWAAAVTACKTSFFAAAPLLLAERLVRGGVSWAVPPLVILSGLSFYGVIAIVHDLAHASFLPSKRWNAIVGYVLAPCILMEFGGFRRSHLEHHRSSQSTADPKRFGAVHSEEANAPDYRTIDHTPGFLRGPVRLGASVVGLPLRVRQVLYLAVAPVFIGPAVMLFGGEFSIVKRDWRRSEAWLATAQGATVTALLGWWSPPLLLLFLIALVLGYATVFFVFAAHLSPNQVYWTSEHRAGAVDALNVSDIHCGRLLRWLGNAISENHSTHHLCPSIPCYRLTDASMAVADELSPHRAPAIDLLDPEACALLYDSYFRGIVGTNAEAWDYTQRGALRSLGG